ncbi:hypothetical protein OG21DRAFT_1433429 [Imleria badia]|nr:hypothetical protein OG21DRAFT_1433429 [Imleria badia]
MTECPGEFQRLARPRLYNPRPLPSFSLMASNTNAERDTQLLSVGQQCSEASCLLVEFLPFKCQHCSQSFCGEHFLVAAHRCPQYDESKHNRVAPSCPLCNTPVAIPPGEDPNIRMERHISTECSVMTGKSGRTRSQPLCARSKCGKVLYAPIACNACKKQYCPQHRFPKDHSCSSPASTAASSSNSRNTSSLGGSKFSAKTFTTQTSNASSSRVNPLPSSSRTATTSNVAALSNPFSKTDRTISSPTPPPKSASPSSSPTAEPKSLPIECRMPSDSQIANILDPWSFVPRPIFSTA